PVRGTFFCARGFGHAREVPGGAPAIRPAPRERDLTGPAPAVWQPPWARRRPGEKLPRQAAAVAGPATRPSGPKRKEPPGGPGGRCLVALSVERRARHAGTRRRLIMFDTIGYRKRAAAIRTK